MIRHASSPSTVAPSALPAPDAEDRPRRFLESRGDDTVHPFHDSTSPRQRPHIDDLIHASSDAIRPAKRTAGDGASSHPGSTVDSESNSRFALTDKLSPARTTSTRLRRVIGVGDSRVRQAGTIRILEDDIVAHNYRRLRPIELVECGPNLVDKPPPSDTHPVSAAVGLISLFVALAIASSPLFDTSIDAELLVDNSGLIVKKNASYAKAYFLGNGFYADFVKTMKSNNTAVNWFPQPQDTKFLNHNPKNPIECIVMTGHQGGVSSYGVCRNGSEFVTVQYIACLVTPADVGGFISAGTWVENTHEVLFTGLKKPSTCVDGKKIVVSPDIKDWRLMSGPFAPSLRGVTNQWLDTMGLPVPVRQRMFYLNGKAGSRLGITVPNNRRQSFDTIVSQSVFGSTLADTLEIQAPFPGSKYAFITLYRISSARIVLPRLQFTFAVAGQSLGLLAFMLALTLRNGPTRSYHLVVQILRLPTFCNISLQLMYVMYYQIFSIGYLATNPTLHNIFAKKVMYVAGVSYILMHQMDVRSAVTQWPRMANNDSYYVARLTWMLGSLSVLIWSLNQKNPDHYVVTSRPDCPLGAMECNTTVWFFAQHYICMGIFLGHPLAYGIIQIVQWYRNRSEYSPRDERHPDYVTSFEAYGCGGPLTEYYYYHTLVTKEIETPKDKDKDKEFGGNARTLQYLTCAKAVRDEGFVLLGGCQALVRAKDLYVVLLMKILPQWIAGTINLSIVVAYIMDLRLTPLRRVSYHALWLVAQRWDGTVSYPDIG